MSYKYTNCIFQACQPANFNSFKFKMQKTGTHDVDCINANKPHRKLITDTYFKLPSFYGISQRQH